MVREAILETTGGQTTYNEMVDAAWNQGELRYGFVFPLSVPPLNHWGVHEWRRNLSLLVLAWTYVAKMVAGVGDAKSPLEPE